MQSKKRYYNFDIIRLIAAIMVVYSHSYVLSGFREPIAVVFKDTFGGLGVAIFLMISGYLVSQSWERTGRFGLFMEARLLRILPGLITTVLLCVFVLGPLVTSLSLMDYFHNWSTVDYFKNITMYGVRYNLPGVFENNPYKFAVNGSLWTLCYEFTFYIVLAIVCIVTQKTNRGIKVSLAFIVIGLIGMQMTNIQQINMYSINLGIFFKLFTYFSIGFFYNEYSQSIPMKKSIFLLTLLIAAISTKFGGLSDYGLFIIGSYIIFYIGTACASRLDIVSSIGDLSYGTYVYAFPVQQAVTYFKHNQISQIENFLIALPITLVISYFSWHLIEKKCLRLKRLKTSN